jgi:hypothetical protein
MKHPRDRAIVGYERLRILADSIFIEQRPVRENLWRSLVSLSPPSFPVFTVVGNQIRRSMQQMLELFLLPFLPFGEGPAFSG